MSSDQRASHAFRAAFVSGVTLILGATEIRAQVAYSITAASPSAPLVSNSSVLTRPVGGVPPPAVALPPLALGLAGAPGDELDAISYGGPLPAAASMFFSVDAASVGIPGVPPNVASEAAVLQAAGDVYVFPPLNALFLNQATLGELPPIPPFVLAVPPVDNLDALDLGATLAGPAPAPFVPPPFFSLAPGNTFGLSGADLLGPGPAVVMPAAGLGLAVADDVDALHVDTATGAIYFSLAPGSPSLFVVSAGCPVPPCSPADIFFLPGGVLPFLLFAPAAALGLLPPDNVDAIAFDTDSDGDGVPNSADNCPVTANPAQCDANLDGCGSPCDADIAPALNDGIVGGADLALLGASFGMLVPPGTGADITCDGVVGGPDLVILGMYFGSPAGPGLVGVCP